MAKKSNLISETTMYSINPGSGTVVVHHLPWPKTSPQLEKYIARGLTFDSPQQTKCPVCGRVCKSDFGLKAHLRSHKGVVNG